MKTAITLPPLSWPVRVALLAALLVSLALAAPVGAQDDFGHATITLLAPGAPENAWASVQWQDRAGTWRNVEGWQAPLEMGEEQATPFKQWAVYPRDYGRGPFRWVVTLGQGGNAWATSGNFFLPVGDGSTHTLTVAPMAAGGPTDVVGALPSQNFSTITIHAPGAPDGAWVGVQWRDGNGRWNNVEGWQAPLEMPEATTTAAATGDDEAADPVPTRQFGVFERDYGDGPFRWIIYDNESGAVYGTSNRFFLPAGGGTNLTMTVLPKITMVPAETLLAEVPSGFTTLQAETSTRGLSCGGQACNFSVISISVPDAPTGSRVGVQWQDPFGVWHDVLTWQASLSTAANTDVGYQQWTIGPELQGRGPFRWVIYNALGDTVLGATPGFMLPDRNGVNVNTTLPSAALDIAG